MFSVNVYMNIYYRIAVQIESSKISDTSIICFCKHCEMVFDIAYYIYNNKFFEYTLVYIIDNECNSCVN